MNKLSAHAMFICSFTLKSHQSNCIEKAEHTEYTYTQRYTEHVCTESYMEPELNPLQALCNNSYTCSPEISVLLC